MKTKQQINFNVHLPFWILTIAISIIIIIPKLLQDGMFMDGVLYASVAKNLSNGIGTFWFPKFSELGFAGHTTFHEHPPFVFWLQAQFFKLLGNSLYAERMYSLIVAFVTGILIHKIWLLLFDKSDELKKFSWLPILIWVIVPLSSWSIQHNMLETTMGIFCLLSIYFSIKFLLSNSKKKYLIIISGIFIFLSSFSKGIPGLFPIGALFFYWLLNRKELPFLKMVTYTLILVMIPALIYFVIIFNNKANESFSIYVIERLIGRIDDAPTVSNRFSTIFSLIYEHLKVSIFTLIILVLYKFKIITYKFNKAYIKKIAYFIILGLTGSVPLTLTMVQKRFYYTHSLPFFSLGIALILAPAFLYLSKIIKRRKYITKILTLIAMIVSVYAIFISYKSIGQTKQDQDVLQDLYSFGKIIPKNSTISIEHAMWNDWSLQCYLIRYFNISVDYRKEKNHPFYLLDKSIENQREKEYQKIILNTLKYDLYQYNHE